MEATAAALWRTHMSTHGMCITTAAVGLLVIALLLLLQHLY
jgi:hypothetical protein